MDRLTLTAGDRVRLRPGDRPRHFAFGRGMAEYGEARFLHEATTVTLAGRSFAVRDDGERLSMRDDEDDEVLAAEPARKGRLRIGEHELALPGKKPGRLGDAGEVRVQSGIVVLELRAPVAPLVALFAQSVVVLRLGLALPRDQRPDWNPKAQDSYGVQYWAT